MGVSSRTSAAISWSPAQPPRDVAQRVDPARPRAGALQEFGAARGVVGQARARDEERAHGVQPVQVEGRHDAAAIDEASRRFDLSPLEEEFLLRNLKRKDHEQ